MPELNETVVTGMDGKLDPTAGSAGVESQLPGSATTVSNVAGATGGIEGGNLVEPDIDDKLFKFQSEDTALMSLMLKARKVKVTSPIVQHYMIDEQRSMLTTDTAVSAGNGQQFVLPLVSKDQAIPRNHHTLLVRGVDGWNEKGNARTPGKDLMLFVTGRSETGNPIVRAINGPKGDASSLYCTTPEIPAGVKVVLMANAMYETQKEVDPDLIVPQPTEIYLQKRGMNQIVSDYFDAQKKRIPFAQKVIAEAAIYNFKRAGNRTLWMGRKGKIMVRSPKGTGDQMVLFTEGIRWQFKKELQHFGKWSYEQLIALAKMFYTGEDVPKSAMLLAGKNLIEELQCIDFSKHPEVTVAPFKHPTLGWTVTRIHTYFGDIDIKREPTLDTLGLSNSGALIGEDRLVHYVYSVQHEFSNRVDGEEAERKGVLVWDGLGLKGACHIWIDGEGHAANAGATAYRIWEGAEAPTGADLVDGMVYYLLDDCPGISDTAQNGQMWQAEVTETTQGGNTVKTATWKQYEGEVMAISE